MRCKKMTDITRRNFLKSAGVMALAVAAAGVLSGCNSSKNPVMADVEVQYWYESNILGRTQVDGGSYTETVSVVKGGKVKKEQIEKTLKDILTNKTFKPKNEELTEFDVDWTAEKPVAKIEMVTA
ncbi:MAG: twin-arginine translocation signal domain-containing protein [Faecalibacterium prausnitzii]